MNALDDLQAVVFEWRDRNLMIKPTLRQLTGTHSWRLQLVELTEDNSYHTNKLDRCIEWVNGQLENWTDCNRTAWDMWDFKSKKDAEKFITLFHLSCPVK